MDEDAEDEDALAAYTREADKRKQRKHKANASDAKKLKKKDEDEDRDDKRVSKKSGGGTSKTSKITFSSSSQQKTSAVSSSKASDSQKEAINLADDTEESEKASDEEENVESDEEDAYVVELADKPYSSKYGREYSKADDFPPQPNEVLETNVSFEHIIEITMPNSAYSEQGERLHKPSLMQAKNDFPPDISDIAFIPRLEIVVNPKSVVKVIYKRGQILKVAAESDHLLRGLSTSELVRFLDVSTCEQTFSRLLSGAVRQATDNMKRMNIDVGNDWASILEPIPGGIS